MKKVLVFILAFLSSAAMFGQTLHYQADYSGCGNTYTKITGVFAIDGEQIYNGVGMQNQGGQNIEIAAFDQDNICRFTRLPQWRAKDNAYVYQMSLRGKNEPQSVYHFKVYDHNTNTELDLVDDFGEVIVYVGGANHGSLTNFYVMNFTAPTPPAETFTREVAGYGTNEGGYVLLASPINDADPAMSEMIATNEDDYDLFYFDQSADLQWINYKAGAYNLEVGKGYLYAHKNGTTVTVTGTPYTGDGMIPLDYDATSLFKGYNLIGNPFGTQATLTSHPYYKLDETGTYFDATPEQTEAIGCMYGVLVMAEGENEFADFDPVTGGKGNNGIPMANVIVSNNGKRLDKAIIRFDEGKRLGKLQLKENSTKVYLPQDGSDYAIANATSNEMPLNFKAEENGNYTISFTAENVGFNYLHLIDNMTGNDVDLLETPSYSFDARTTDYASRFRLLFAKANAVMGDDFGFFDANGKLTILGIEGEANIQVIDVTGRVIRNETFSRDYRKAVNAASGVYMLRLIQGNDVRTQKIIVK